MSQVVIRLTAACVNERVCSSENVCCISADVNVLSLHFRDKMTSYKSVPLACLALLSIGLLSSRAYGVAVMSVDLGSENMKIAIVTVRIESRTKLATS